MDIKIKDVMTSPVATLLASSNVGRVREILLQKGVSALPIVEIKDENVILKGIVTHTDLVGVFDDTVPVVQVMSKLVYSISPDISLKEAAQTMMNKKVHHLVVLSEGRITGILSSLDFVKFIASH